MVAWTISTRAGGCLGKAPRTWADLIREQARRRGLLTTADERQRWKSVLDGFSRQRRTAFAAAAAQPLLRAREAVCLPGDYVLGWRPVLEGVWHGLEGDDSAFTQTAGALADFYRSPQFHDDGATTPNEANDNAVISVYYAAECLIHPASRPAPVRWLVPSDTSGWRQFAGRSQPGRVRVLRHLANPLR